MKIALLSMTRTRSSFLLDVLCKNYNVPNLFEYYSNKFQITTYPEKFIDKNKVWSKFNTEMELATKDLFDNYPSYGMKIFPGNVLNFFKMNPIFFKNFEKNNYLKKGDIIDFRNLKLDCYDKIILLERKNIVDLVCSQYYALQVHKFLHTKDEQKTIELFRPNGKLFLPAHKDYFLRIRIYSHLFLSSLPQLLKNQGLDFIHLYYDDVPNFIRENYPDIESDYVDTEFDYKNEITNYEEIEKQVMEIYNDCKNNTNFSELFNL